MSGRQTESREMLVKRLNSAERDATRERKCTTRQGAQHQQSLHSRSTNDSLPAGASCQAMEQERNFTTCKPLTTGSAFVLNEIAPAAGRCRSKIIRGRRFLPRIEFTLGGCGCCLWRPLRATRPSTRTAPLYRFHALKKKKK